jgi:hypothetical protein
MRSSTKREDHERNALTWRQVILGWAGGASRIDPIISQMREPKNLEALGQRPNSSL